MLDGYPKPVSSRAVPDPILVHRRRADRLARLGQRIGYSLFGLAIGLFFIGLIGNFTAAIGQAITGAIVLGSLVLAPAIVVTYAVRAADQEDEENGHTGQPTPPPTP